MTRPKAMKRIGSKASAESCGAPRKTDGKPCEQAAGWGTGHVGEGPCKLHGGCLPNVERHYAVEVSLAFAAHTLGADVATNPLDTMLQSVRLAAGVVAYWRAQLSAAYREDRPVKDLADGYIEALKMLNAFSKTALDADVDSRLVAIAERVGDTIVAAIEEGLTELDFLSMEQRTLLAQSIGRSLAKREPDAIEGTAHELPAG